MALTKDNVIVGAVTALEFPSGTNIGGTKGGVTLMLEQELFDKVGDQIKGKLDRVLTLRSVRARTELLESTIVNLHKASNLAAAQLSGSSLSITDSEGALQSVKFTGPAPNGGTRTVILDSCRQVGNTEFTYGRDVDVRFPMELEAMWDPTNNRFGIIGN